METIKIQINKRTKAGKAFMEMLEYFSKNTKGVKIENQPTQADLKPHVLKTFEETDAGKNLINTKSHKDLLEKLYS